MYRNVQKCFRLYLFNGKRYRKNSKGFNFSMKRACNGVIFLKIGYQVSTVTHFKKRQPKKSDIFVTDKVIAKFLTVLNSASC